MTGKTTSAMRVQLSEARREQILRKLAEMYAAEFDEELSTFRAGQILGFFMENLGPAVYNQAIQDARGFMMDRLDDLDATFHEDDGSGQQRGDEEARADDPAAP